MPPISVRLLEVNVHPTSYTDVTTRVQQWVRSTDSRCVYFANVHVLMEAHDDAGFGAMLNRADLVNPDGVPLVWALRMLGHRASRVYGPDCTLRTLEMCERNNIPVGFYGSSVVTLMKLIENVRMQWPALQIAYSCAPPFRELRQDEDEQIVADIRASGTRVLFVGLGCPKQEHWIASHQGRIPAVMMGVGAAFDFVAGTKAQAPRWMMRAGLEWLFRLATEPARLWRRYIQNNPRFIWLCAKQILHARTAPRAQRLPT